MGILCRLTQSAPDIAKASNTYESETDGRRDADQWNRDRTYSEQVENSALIFRF